MIEWFERQDGAKPFLFTPDRTWTYSETLAEVGSRQQDRALTTRLGLDPESVFAALAGISGGGLVATPPGTHVGEVGPADLVVFTSGTSGKPKGVRLTMSNLEAAARASALHLGHDSDDNWLLAMPLHHVGGLSILVRQAYTGGSVTLLPEFDPATFGEAMKGPVTVVSVVARMLRRLLPYAPFDGLRAVLVGGGPIPVGLLADGVEAGMPVLPTYGLTETFGQIATLRPGSPVEHKAHPLPGVELEIRSGRIAVRSPQLFAGYVGQPDRDDDWFVTSDLGSIGPDGALVVEGRADSVIVTGGENVNPERVEEALRRFVDDIVVVGVDDRDWGQAVVCLYEGAIEPEALEREARERLEPFMVPRRFVSVAEVPKTSIGKPDRTRALQLL